MLDCHRNRHVSVLCFSAPFLPIVYFLFHVDHMLYDNWWKTACIHRVTNLRVENIFVYYIQGETKK